MGQGGSLLIWGLISAFLWSQVMKDCFAPLARRGYLHKMSYCDGVVYSRGMQFFSCTPEDNRLSDIENRLSVTF